MQALLLPALAATSAGLFGYGITQAVRGLLDPSRRRLAQRLGGGESSAASPASASQVVRLVNADPEDVPGVLGRFQVLRDLNRAVIQAYPNVTLRRFLAVSAACGVGGFFVVTALTATFLVGFVALALGTAAPYIALVRKRGSRQRALSDQIPDALDFLGRALKAGHSLSTGLQMIGDEMPQPLAGEFRRCYDQHSLGLPMEKAMREMVQRIDSTDFAFFVTAVLVQRQTGGDLSEVLNNISGMIRQRVRLQQHVKSKTAEGRFTGYVLAAFPSVMFVIAYILSPEYAKPLVETRSGQTMLLAAFTMQGLGLFCIQKLTTVKV